jgi:hypothetical protein
VLPLNLGASVAQKAKRLTNNDRHMWNGLAVKGISEIFSGGNGAVRRPARRWTAGTLQAQRFRVRAKWRVPK